MEEMAKSLPAVALDEEGSHSLPLRFLGREVALLAVEEAEINGFHQTWGRWDPAACMT